MGWKDTVLLERDKLTSGTTWHVAGLMVTFGSTSETSTEMRKYTRDLYARLEAETGQDSGFRPVGFIEVAADRYWGAQAQRSLVVERFKRGDLRCIVNVNVPAVTVCDPNV
jgi:glycine/D-amino acid oxidase-like deaminating enzyme